MLSLENIGEVSACTGIKDPIRNLDIEENGLGFTTTTEHDIPFENASAAGNRSGD
jgi:hypothetical protein